MVQRKLFSFEDQQLLDHKSMFLVICDSDSHRVYKNWEDQDACFLFLI